MAQASFGGVACFGVPGACYSNAVPNEPRFQLMSFNGVDGRARQQLGSNGGTVAFQWLAAESSEGDLAAYESTWRGWMTGGTVATLVDTLGVAYPNCVLAAWQPATEVEPDGFGGVTREYEAVFEVL